MECEITEQEFLEACENVPTARSDRRQVGLPLLLRALRKTRWEHVHRCCVLTSSKRKIAGLGRAIGGKSMRAQATGVLEEFMANTTIPAGSVSRFERTRVDRELVSSIAVLRVFFADWIKQQYVGCMTGGVATDYMLYMSTGAESVHPISDGQPQPRAGIENYCPSIFS